jgi:hypothetical protein
MSMLCLADSATMIPSFSHSDLEQANFVDIVIADRHEMETAEAELGADGSGPSCQCQWADEAGPWQCLCHATASQKHGEDTADRSRA